MSEVKTDAENILDSLNVVETNLNGLIDTLENNKVGSFNSKQYSDRNEYDESIKRLKLITKGLENVFS